MKVKAKRLGYIGLRRRNVGDVFHIEDKAFSEAWMENLDGGVIKKVEEEDYSSMEKKEKVNSRMTMNDLYKYCRNNGLEGFSGMNKSELVDAINDDELTSTKSKQDEDNDVI